MSHVLRCSKFIGTSTKASDYDLAPIEKKVNGMIKEMLTYKHIDYKVYAELMSTGSSINRLYGLPKIHKIKEGEARETIPMRPILDMSQAPTTKIAKSLVKILEAIQDDLCKFSLKDTFTMEKEKDNCLPFLDVKVCRGPDGSST